jgi:preprotein translocase subunit SecE
MEVYRKGQADTYRIVFGVILLLTGLFAAYKWFTYFRGETVSSAPVDWIGAAILVLIGLGTAYYFAAVHKKTVDYVIDTDEEMRKVTWPTKEELKDSSVLVIVVMLILGVITSALDAAFLQLFKLFT